MIGCIYLSMQEYLEYINKELKETIQDIDEYWNIWTEEEQQIVMDGKLYWMEERKKRLAELEGKILIQLIIF